MMRNTLWNRLRHRLFGTPLKYTPSAGMTPEQIGRSFMLRPEDCHPLKIEGTNISGVNEQFPHLKHDSCPANHPDHFTLGSITPPYEPPRCRRCGFRLEERAGTTYAEFMGKVNALAILLFHPDPAVRDSLRISTTKIAAGSITPDISAKDLEGGLR